MSRNEFAEVIITAGPFRFTVHGEHGETEKPFATLDEPRPYALSRGSFDIARVADQMRRLAEAS